MQTFKFGPLQQMAQIEYVNLQGHIEEITGDLYVHLTGFESHKWTVGLYKKMLKTWSEIQVYLKDVLEISVMKTLIKEDDIVNEKFLELFGFVGEDQCIVLDDGRRFLIMEVEF